MLHRDMYEFCTEHACMGAADATHSRIAHVNALCPLQYVHTLLQVQGTHPYSGEDTDELSFEAGDVINVLPFEDPEDQVCIARATQWWIQTFCIVMAHSVNFRIS